MSTGRWWVGAGGALVVAGALGACDSAGPTDPVADCLEAAGVTGPAVVIRNFTFSPATLRVAPGSRVTWVNCEGPQVEAHTSTSDDGVWASPFLSSGDVFSRDFEQAGSFPYHCVPHPSMEAVVIVEDGA